LIAKASVQTGERLPAIGDNLPTLIAYIEAGQRYQFAR